MTRPVLYFVVAIICHTVLADVSINFTEFEPGNFTFFGDFKLIQEVIALTSDEAISSNAGTAIYNMAILFPDPTTTSFTTCFKFGIDVEANQSSFGTKGGGGGLTWFLSPDKEILGSPGKFLGLFNASNPEQNKFIAIEFDTWLDPEFEDLDDNHVGIDINGLFSIKAVNVMQQNITLKNGGQIRAWIYYSSEQKKIEIFLSYTDVKPIEPILFAYIDLFKFIQKCMYIGFSASTEKSMEVHYIVDWSFKTYGVSSVGSNL